MGVGMFPPPHLIWEKKTLILDLSTSEGQKVAAALMLAPTWGWSWSHSYCLPLLHLFPATHHSPSLPHPAATIYFPILALI